MGKIVAQDGPATLVSSGAGLNKVSTRELQHNALLRYEEKDDEATDSSPPRDEDKANGATDTSDVESIPEARLEASLGEEIPEIHEVEVRKWQKTKDAEDEMSLRHEIDEGNGIRIAETIWSDVEGPVTEPIHPQFMRPRR